MNVAPIIWTLIFYIFCSVVAIQLFYYLYFFISLNGGFEKNSECLVSLANRCSALGREVLTTQRSGAARTTVKKDAGGNAARFGASVRAGAVSRRSRRRQGCGAG